MKLVILIIAISTSTYLVHAEEPDGILEFKKEVRKSISSKDSRNLCMLFDWEGVEDDQRQSESLRWALDFAHDFKNEHSKISRIDWVSKEDFRSTKVIGLSKTTILGKVVVTGTSMYDGKVYPYKHSLYAGKDSKERWRLVKVNIVKAKSKQ